MKGTKSKINNVCVQVKRVGDVVPGVMVSLKFTVISGGIHESLVTQLHQKQFG